MKLYIFAEPIPAHFFHSEITRAQRGETSPVYKLAGFRQFGQ